MEGYRHSWFHNVCTLLVLLGVCFQVSQGQSGGCQQEVNCKLPDCFCPTETHPLGRDSIPQIVYFGFDDAVQPQVAGYYDTLMTEQRKNPNGCPITMTLYISHEYTKYDLVSKYYKKGDGMGVHSVTHQNIDTAAKLMKEATEQKNNIHQLANVPDKDIIGWRSPNLKTAGDDQPRVLKQLNYTYDNSLSYSKDRNYQFPFTLDFGYPYPCVIPPCPTSKHEGFWELMIHSFVDPVTERQCGYVDGCQPASRQDAVEYLWTNFLTTYENEKAPFGLNMHAAWFGYPNYLEAMEEFVDRILQLDDVYIVSVEKMMQWMKSPVPLSDINNFAPWGCSGASRTQRPTSHAGGPRPRLPVSRVPTRPVDMGRNTNGDQRHQNSATVAKTQLPPQEPFRFQNWFQRYADTMKTDWKATTPTERPTVPTPATVYRPRQRPSPVKGIAGVSETSHGIRSSDTETCTQGENCRLPQCYCKTSNPPNRQITQRSPQLVYLSIETPIDGRTYGPLTQILFSNRFNRNGCPVTGSIFIPPTGNYPPYVRALASMGASMGFQLGNGTLTDREMEFLVTNVNEMHTSLSVLSGLRIHGTDTGYSPEAIQVLQAFNGTQNKFVVRERSEASWPHTLDFGVTDRRCPFSSDCKTKRYPGIWEVPLSRFRIPGKEERCWYPQSCPGTSSEMETYRMLKYNFNLHYLNKRLPLGIALNEDWLVKGNNYGRIRGFNLFIEDIIKKSDVMVVSVDRILNWIKSTGDNGMPFSC